MATRFCVGRWIRLRLLVVAACITLLIGCEGDVASSVANAYASVKGAVENRLDGKLPVADADKSKNKKKRKRTHLVELATVQSEPLHITSVYTGSLRARKVLRVHAQEEGAVSEVAFFEGESVARGARLLAIDDTLLQASLSKADAVLAESVANIKRLDGLRRKRLVGEDEFLRAQTAARVAEAERRVLTTRIGFTRINAPFDGVISQRLVEPGDVVREHQHVLTLIDPNALTLDIWAAEILVANLARGDHVRVRIDALGVSDYPGRVVRIFPELNPRTRQGRVEIGLAPVPEGARPGQFARVTFDVTTQARTVIPFGALRRDRDAEFVYRVQSDLRTERVVVRSGRRVADRVEILEGLKLGDKVVLRGFLGLSEGKQVKPVSAQSGRD